MVLFSPNTSRDQRTILRGLLGMTVVENLNNYLGLPIPIGKKKTTAFQEITNRLSCRISYGVDKASFTWSSIAAAAEAFKVSFGWQIGNGGKIDIRVDNWGLEGLNWDTITSNTLNQNEKSVKVLWHADSRRWNVNKVKKVYGHDWGDKICNISIGNEEQEDKMIWFHNPHGCFTSKSTYSWLLLKEMGYGPHRYFWKALWKLDTLSKIRVFTWRVGHEILPMSSKITTNIQGFDKGCHVKLY
ncbi:hypothetical protein Goshw_018646 [Gossypium schwendimanii]|uniref:Reverse transcriptase zinc-binding domain-containing protein n=1 Tax=Gossypium schwendimanii TaxID=34291 RepID=A0A7J9M5D8_GOSSC|nr:hypothetical protein [Gossypium schwendimanii]